MRFSAIAWLWGIAPWIALTVWLWRHQAPAQAVPFIHLWPQMAAVARRSKRPPPAKTILVLAAILAAIIGAADPHTPPPPSTETNPVTPAAQGAEIVGVAMADDPTAQLMISIRNRSSEPSTVLRISDDQATIDHPLQLPRIGDTQNYFINLPAPGQHAIVDLNGTRWQLDRRPGWPRVEADSAISEDVRRMIQAYSITRTGNRGKAIRVSDSRDGEVIVARGGQSFRVKTIRAADCPIVAHAQLGSLIGEEVQLAEEPTGFLPVLWLNDKPGISVKESPRKVWVGLSSEALAKSTSYVVLWTDLLDWVGAASSGYDVSHDAALSTPRPTNTIGSDAAISLSPWLFIVALSCLALANVPSARRT